MIRLTEGITHLEDLPVDKFISVLKNLSSYIAQEKMDGAQLWLGIDNEGQLFTSREGKRVNSERHYKVSDWAKISSFNQFRAAHAAILEKEADIKQILKPGEIVELEVLYGSQPNAVTYGADGKSYIAVLRGVQGTPDAQAQALAKALLNKTVDVKIDIVSSDDGQNIKNLSQDVSFEFTEPQVIEAGKLQHEEVTKAVTNFEKFLDQKSSVPGMSNLELATVSLNTIPKEKRDAIKTARQDLISQINVEHKLKIKRTLLDKIIRHLKSNLSSSSSDSIGVEGIVLRDQATGDQIKIVDKDVFSAINVFNQSIRGQIQGGITSTDPDASLEAHGGIIGELRIRIAGLLGNREFAKTSNTKKAMAAIKGSDPADTIRKFANTMSGIDDFQQLRLKSLAMCSAAAKRLNDHLNDFKKNKDEYRLKLKDGREYKLSDETVKKTLAIYAEAKQALNEIFTKLKSTENLAQFLAALYGGAAKAVHDSDAMNESLLLEKKRKKHASFGEIDKSEFENKDAFHLINSYLAVVFMTFIFYHTNDVIGMRKLRDRKNYLLKRWSTDMSLFNHWGYMMWQHQKPDMKKVLSKDTERELIKATKHIPHTWWRLFHMDFSLNKEVTVNWADHRKMLTLLIQHAGLRSDRLNTLLDWSIRYPELSYDEQIKALNKLYMFIMQFIPRNTLFIRFRAIQAALIDAPKLMQESLLKQLIAISEEDGAAVTSTATTAGAVETLPTRIGVQRTIIRRRRNPDVKRLQFKFPDPRKESK